MARLLVPSALAVFMLAGSDRAESAQVVGIALAGDPAKTERACRLRRALEIVDVEGFALGRCVVAPEPLASRAWPADWLGIHDPIAPWSPGAGAISARLSDRAFAIPPNDSRRKALYAVVREPRPSGFGVAGMLATMLPRFVGWATAASVTLTYLGLELAAWLSCRSRRSRAVRRPAARPQSRLLARPRPAFR